LKWRYGMIYVIATVELVEGKRSDYLKEFYPIFRTFLLERLGIFVFTYEA
jgi:hypothetical protein